MPKRRQTPWRNPLDSNVDAGQDLLYLKRWLNDRPENRAVTIVFNGLCPPKLAGITSNSNRVRVLSSVQEIWKADDGVAAISVNSLLRRKLPNKPDELEVPVGNVGYSIWLFEINR